MRLFDMIGSVVVVAWLILVGVFAFFALDEGQTHSLSFTDGEVILTEEPHWMIVLHDAEEIGVAREDRTRLVDGWLIELQGYIELDLLQTTYPVRFDSKANLAEDLSLRTALVTVEAFGMKIQISGRYHLGLGSGSGHDDEKDHRFDLVVDFNDATRQLTRSLDQRPFLAAHIFPRLLATGDLEPGDRFEQQFFDPLTLAPSTSVITYEGREEVDVYGQTFHAHGFHQRFANQETLTHTDSYGQMVRQIMSFQYVLMRSPEFMGRQNFRDAQARFDESNEEAPAFIEALDAEALLSLLGHVGGGRVTPFQSLDDDQEND